MKLPLGCSLMPQAVAELQGQGIKKVDVVIANAAINLSPGTSFKDIDVDEQMETLNVNVGRPAVSNSTPGLILCQVLADMLAQVRGPLVLFQATWDLLEPHKGKYVVISSGAGTIGQKHGGKGNGIYGQSKVTPRDPVPRAGGTVEDRCAQKGTESHAHTLTLQAALNFFVAKAHAENPDRIVLALNPGWVPT